MDDLISRQAAIDFIDAGRFVNPNEPRWSDNEVVNFLKSRPSVQPERKKGKWIDKSGGIEGAWNYCSVCGEQAIDLYDFCPNCGSYNGGDKNDRKQGG